MHMVWDTWDLVWLFASISLDVDYASTDNWNKTFTTLSKWQGVILSKQAPGGVVFHIWLFSFINKVPIPYKSESWKFQIHTKKSWFWNWYPNTTKVWIHYQEQCEYWIYSVIKLFILDSILNFTIMYTYSTQQKEYVRTSQTWDLKIRTWTDIYV